MKIKIPCTVCSFANGDNIVGKTNSRDFHFSTIGNSPIYSFSCVNGHEVNIHLTNTTTEIFFESGINAMHDGYLREAITSFHAALETFYVEITLALSFVNGKDVSVLKSGLNKLRQSERKIGAFSAIYFISTGKFPNLFKEDYLKVRNRVVHGSHYPSLEDTVKFGHHVRNYIFEISDELNLQYPKIFHKIFLANFHDFRNLKLDGTSNFRTYINQYLNKLNGDPISILDYKSNWQYDRERT